MRAAALHQIKGLSFLFLAVIIKEIRHLENGEQRQFVSGDN